MNEWLRAYAARSEGWCDFYEPGREVMQWEAGSSYFEVDGLHLTRSGYALLALLLLRGRTLRDFLTKRKGRAAAISISPPEISLREISLPEIEISLPEITDAEAVLRRRMRGWMEQYRVAVDGVQDQVFDVQMAKASREELEALHRVLQACNHTLVAHACSHMELEALHRVLQACNHTVAHACSHMGARGAALCVLQAEGLAGLTAAAEALELEALHRALLEGGQRGLDAAVRPITQKAKRACNHCAPSLSPHAPGAGDAEGEEGSGQGEAPRPAPYRRQACGRGQARPDGLRAPGRRRPHGSGTTAARGARPPCEPLCAPRHLALVR